MNTLEYVADAIMKFEGWQPGSVSYTHRNPGNIMIEDPLTKKLVYATYSSLVEGYTALLVDLKGKFSGNNSNKLTPDSTLYQLMAVYAPPSDNPTFSYTQFIATWLTKCLSKQITVTTTLKEIWSEDTSH